MGPTARPHSPPDYGAALCSVYLDVAVPCARTLVLGASIQTSSSGTSIQTLPASSSAYRCLPWETSETNLTPAVSPPSGVLIANP